MAYNSQNKERTRGRKSINTRPNKKNTNVHRERGVAMFGRAITLDRYTTKESEDQRKDIFADWAKVFEEQCERELIEMFINEGTTGNVAVILFDGKEYWCPYYDDNEPHLHQWIRKTGSSYDNYDQLTKEYHNIGDYELNVPDWLEIALEAVQDDGVVYLNWENYGTTVPLII